MKIDKHSLILIFTSFYLLFFITISRANNKNDTANSENIAGNFQIGWSVVDITPNKPVLLSGQYRARVSEYVNDPIYATALAMERGSGPSSKKVIMVSCDLLAIHDGIRDGAAENLRDNVRKQVVKAIPSLNFKQIIIHATHTHTAPEISNDKDSETVYGIKLDAMSPAECLEFISSRIAKAAEEAWKNRKPGGISYGLDFAVVAHNRQVAYFSGKSVSEGKTNSPEFSHIEGFEDHTINLLYTWDSDKKLTGVVINIAADCQATGGQSFISSDYWYETRKEVRKRLGDNIYILSQCSAAGDQGINIQVGAKAERRMQEMMIAVPDSVEERLKYYMGWRQLIANRIANAVTSIYPYMKEHIEWDPVLLHHAEVINIRRRHISDEDLINALKEAENLKKKYEKLLLEINGNPAVKKKPGWYSEITSTYNRMRRNLLIKERYDLERAQPEIPVEIHLVRLGDVAFASNPFELYLDYGMRIKARSPAVQTFLIQLAGSGTYVPTVRAVAGGAYGAVPASNLIGPEGGQELVEKTLELINTLWQNN